MAEDVRRGEDPESLHEAQRLAVAEEERLVMDVTILTIIKDELPIAEQMKEKRSWMTAEHPSYVAPL